MNLQPKTTLTTAALITLALSLLVLDFASAQYSDSRDGYFRTVEGRAWVTPSNSSSPIEVEANLPVLTGDRLEVQPGARIEVVLPDGTIVRIESGAEITFKNLAQAAETEETSTNLVLTQGEIQVVKIQESADDNFPRVDSINASLYIQDAGLYKISADDYSRTDVVVREGSLEIVTQRGSSFIRTGERASIEGAEWPQVSVENASYLSSLELWGEELDSEARLASDPHIDSSLTYSGTSLAYKGRWIETGGRSAWRPHVSVDWRPYTSGRWHSTPAGLSWVSNEPWGWLTHHYGSWSYSSGYGWLWYPGTTYSPAWVYWYWGSNQVAWSPVGIYTDFYGPDYGQHYPDYGRPGFGYHHGIYGWAGGSAHLFLDWVFCDIRYFGRRNYSGYLRSGGQLARDTRHGSIGRGIITTDTRSITADALRRPTEVVGALGRSYRTRSGQTTNGSGDLTDVTPFIARHRELSSEVAEAVRGSRTTTSVADRSSRLTRSTGSSRSTSPTELSRRLGRPRSGDQRSLSERTRDSAAYRDSTGRSGNTRVFGDTQRENRLPSSPQNSNDWRRPSARPLPDREDQADRGNRTSRSGQSPDRGSGIVDRDRTLNRPPTTDRSGVYRSSPRASAPTRHPSTSGSGYRSPSQPPVRRVLERVRSSASSNRSGTASPATPTSRPTQTQAKPVSRSAPRSPVSTSRSQSSSGKSRTSASKSNQSKSTSSRSRTKR